MWAALLISWEWGAPGSKWNPLFTLCTCRFAFTAVFMLEVLVKMVSRGVLMGKFTFLRNPWNWPDVAVVAAA